MFPFLKIFRDMEYFLTDDIIIYFFSIFFSVHDFVEGCVFWRC